MRLIDADALITELNNLEPRCANRFVQQGIDDGLHFYMPKILEEQPTIDAVPVCRCRDCNLQSGCKVAQRLGNDGFCSYGERKDGDGNG